MGRLVERILGLGAVIFQVRLFVCHTTDIPVLGEVSKALSDFVESFTDWSPDHPFLGCHKLDNDWPVVSMIVFLGVLLLSLIITRGQKRLSSIRLKSDFFCVCLAT